MEGGDPIPQKNPEWPGVVLVCVVAAISFGISSVAVRSGWSEARLLDPVLTSMILGLLIGNLLGGKRFLAGTKFAYTNFFQQESFCSGREWILWPP